MDIIKDLEEIVAVACCKAGFDVTSKDIVIESPKDRSMGDYSTNIAMRFASAKKESPVALAETIVEFIPKGEYLENVCVAGGGFINFYLSNKYYYDKLMDNCKSVNCCESLMTENTVLIEYTDPNPFKPLHVGHLYTNVVGESLARLYEYLDYHVIRVIYQGDVGLHVAKTLWGLEKKLNDEKISFSDIESFTLVDRVNYLGDAYVLGSKAYDEDGVTDEIDELNYYLFSLFIPSLEKKEFFSKYESLDIKYKYEQGKKWCLEHFETIYEKLGTKFDYYFLESQMCDDALKIVKDNLGKIFVNDGDCIIYKGDEDKHLHTRVFVNKYGLPTYESKELALAFMKDKTIKNYDRSLIITANEQNGYFKVVLDALSKVDCGIAKKTQHLSHGAIRLPGNKKMSSRSGGIISAEWLLDETIKRVECIMENKDYEIAEKIAIGAIKYAFLKVGIGGDIVFDFDKAVQFDGDTGPYLMYVYSRCSSILSNVTCGNFGQSDFVKLLDNPYVKELVISLSKVHEVMIKSAENSSPSELCQCLFNLGQNFNSFYQNVRVLDASADDKEVLLYLVKSVSETMKKGLSCLGINVVEHM